MSSQTPSISIRSAKSRLAIALVAAAAALGACGGEDDGGASAEPEPQPGGVVDISGTDAVGENLAGSVASLVECRDWNEASTEQQLATIADVRGQVSREDAAISTPALTDEEASDIFDTFCEPDYAQGFRLYKLYARAAGFAPLGRALEP